MDARLTRAQIEKVSWTLVVLVLGFCGYYAVSLGQDRARARSLAIAFDGWATFNPWWMFAYGGVYTAFLLPIFVVRCEKLFRRVALGFVAILAASYATFFIVPVTTVGFRPEVSALDTTRFPEWGAALNFTLDPPYNCFPSLHVALIVFAALTAWKADRPVGYGAFVLAFVISVSTILVKQHYLADVLAGAVLAVLGYALCVHRYDAVALGKSALEVRYTRLGVVGYVATYVVAVCFVLWPMYVMQWKPWEKSTTGARDVAAIGSH